MSQYAESLGLGRGGFGNRLDDGINAFLSQLRELGLGGAGGADQCAGFLDGQQILVYHVTTPLFS